MRVKSEQRRQAILDIATEEFIKQGFIKTSMSGIAKKLGGSKATLYNYFSSKEEIFISVMESIAKSMVSSFQNLSLEMDIDSALNEFGIGYLKSLCTPEILALTKMAYTEADRSDIGRYFYENGPKKGWKNVELFLDAHIKLGNIISCNTSISAMQLKALLEAELREPYSLGVISRPTDAFFCTIVERAIGSFLILYKTKSH